MKTKLETIETAFGLNSAQAARLLGVKGALKIAKLVSALKTETAPPERPAVRRPYFDPPPAWRHLFKR